MPVGVLHLALGPSCYPGWLATFGGRQGIEGVNVSALAAFDDGSGEALYAGGLFHVAGGTLTLNIARWDGTTWSALGGAPDYGTPLDPVQRSRSSTVPKLARIRLASSGRALEDSGESSSGSARRS